MRYSFYIDTNGKTYRKQRDINYTISNLAVLPDESDPSLISVSFTITLHKPITYITTTFII